MPIATTTEKNSLATKYGADGTFAALFVSDPGTSGTVVGEVSGGSPAYARKALSWSAASGGVVTATVTFDVPASTTVTFAGVCSASTGSTLLDRVSVTSQNFATAGTFQITFTYTQS